MRIVVAAVMLLMLAAVVDASEWAIAYGEWTKAYAVEQTSDGGYIFAGAIQVSDKGSDFWVVKLDANGNVEWQKAYGGNADEDAQDIQQTSDGGYIVVGNTKSFGSGDWDAWILKLDANGNVQWQKVHGGGGTDVVFAVQQTADGGYIVAGVTYSFIEGWWDECDPWILKLDSNGNVEWEKTVEGYEARDIQQTSDGGYILVEGWYDFRVVKLSNNGNIQWVKAYGGSGLDWAYTVQQTADGGYIVAGHTPSFGAGQDDFWVLKLDANGNIQWQNAYGGSGWEVAKDVQQTADGGYIVAGYTQSSFRSGRDFWILKLDANGNVEWQKAYGGDYDEEAYSIQQTADGGYIVAGYTKTFGSWLGSAWILKLDSNGDINNCDAIMNTNAALTSTSATSTTPSDVVVTVISSNAISTNVVPDQTSESPIKVCYFETEPESTWQKYDSDGDDKINDMELINAIMDWLNGNISDMDLLDVIIKWLS